MILRFTPLLFALTLSAQVSVQIDAGSSTESYFAGDPSASYRYTNAFLATQAGVFRDMRASNLKKSIVYDIPVPVGSCSVTLLLIEPREAGPDPSKHSAIGRRVFTASANGVGQTIDIYALAGAQTPYMLTLGQPAKVLDGRLRIALTAITGAAVVSGLDIACQAAVGPPFTRAPDGSWVLTGDLRINGDIKATGFIENGTDSNQPAKTTLRMPDGSSADGVSGTYRFGNCLVTLQAGDAVRVAC